MNHLLLRFVLLVSMLIFSTGSQGAFLVHASLHATDTTAEVTQHAPYLLLKPLNSATHSLRDRYRGRLSTVHGSKGTSIAAGSMSAAAILLIVVGAASGAYFMAFIFAALLVIAGFATGLAALINRCPLKGLAIFSICLFGCLLLYPLILVAVTA